MGCFLSHRAPGTTELGALAGWAILSHPVASTDRGYQRAGTAQGALESVSYSGRSASWPSRLDRLALGNGSLMRPS